MGYTERTIGKDSRKGTSGPLGKLKGKATAESTLKPAGKSPSKKKK